MTGPLHRPLRVDEVLASSAGELEGRCGVCKHVMPLLAGGKAPLHAVDGVQCDGSHDYAVQHVQRIAPPMTLPLPEGCAECGWPRHGHYQRWTATASWHAYVLPGPELVQARMRARFAAKETR